LVPISFQPGVSPFISSLGLKPRVSAHLHDIDVLRYQEQTGVRVDYVLVWGVPLEEYRQAADIYLARIEKHYDLISTSEIGWMRVYRNKETVLP
jgi:hypothetical protein